jgi:glyoxylase-like metal-dependent hydrolase (beta-lactamase superfamily II)
VVDRGFASVRKIGHGAYATISDPSKGSQTTCNGGFLLGKDAAFLIEGFISPAGASFQRDALRMVSQIPVMGALVSHYHYDHSMGTSFYGGNGISLWAHASVARRIMESYAPMQARDKDAFLAPYETRVRDARSQVAKLHAQTDTKAMTEVYDAVNGSMLGLPDHPLEPAKLPLSIDLGGLTAVIEYHPGHSGTDVVVHVPDQNVVYTGDLLFNGKYPVCFDENAAITAWRETLKYFAGLGKDALFVPGHGPLCGQETIATQREIFDDIANQAQQMHRVGIPVGEAQHRYVIPSRFENLPLWSWGFTVGSAITKLYAEWDAAAPALRRL